METPINIVVVLFVALAVGVLLILFSKQIIQGAKHNIKSINNEEDKFIEVPSLSVDDVLSLVQSCHDLKIDSLKKDLCFVVHITNKDQQLPSPENFGGIEGLNVDYNQTSKSLYFYYNPEQGVVEVTD